MLRVADACPVDIEALSTVQGADGRWRVLTAGGEAARYGRSMPALPVGPVLPAQAVVRKCRQRSRWRDFADRREVVVGSELALGNVAMGRR